MVDAKPSNQELAPGLAGRVCVVTGGTRGMGAAIARGAAAAGARLCVIAQDPDRLATFVADLQGQGCTDVMGVPADIADPTSVTDAFRAVVETWGTVDALVNNAGISKVGSSLDYDIADLGRILDVNVTGLFACSQAAARVMASNGGGSIVNIASISSFIGQPERAAYVASKSAVLGMTRSLAVEWGPLGIRVNAVAPGYIRTDLTEDLIRRQVIAEDVIAARTPLRRFGNPGDVVGAVLFLLGDHAQFTTGQVLPVDGGWLANGYFK